MKPDTQKLLNKASRALRAAETLLNSGDADFSAGRAYYAMFYIAEAVEEGLVVAAPAHPCARGIRASCSTQLTYLLFLKMANERTRALGNQMGLLGLI